MNVCCVRVLHRGWDEISWGAEGRILQWKCSIAMAGWGGGAFLVFVCEQPPNFFLPHWATDGCCFCGRVWSTTHTHTHTHAETHTWGVDEWQAWLPHRTYWWHHCWASGHSTLSMFQRAIQSASSAPWLFHRHDAYCLLLVIIQFSRLRSGTKYFSFDSDGTINNWPVYDLPSVQYRHLWRERI